MEPPNLNLRNDIYFPIQTICAESERCPCGLVTPSQSLVLPKARHFLTRGPMRQVGRSGEVVSDQATIRHSRTLEQLLRYGSAHF